MSESEAAEAPGPMLVDCEGCERTVLAKVLAQSYYFKPEEGPPERWSFVICNNAGHPMLVLQNDYGIEGLTFDDDTPWRAYPAQDRALSHGSQLPCAERWTKLGRALRPRLTPPRW